jgi:phenylpropionate dioxygenase-like ring-hydroxylating dioxygenase large terminal subunit
MSTTASVRTETAPAFDWRRCWYPVCLVEDLPDGPLGVAVHGHSLVLFRAEDGRLVCLDDRCPHRAARLSDGRVRNGVIECMYHGWRFDAGGRCIEVPQLAEGAAIPERACVRPRAVVERQGIAWVWPGDPADADASAIPLVPELDRPDVTSLDFMMDLPYAQDFLVENVIDVAHIHVAHDGIRGGGRRELAGPLAFDVTDDGARGFRAAFASARAESPNGTPPLRAAGVAFVAPNLVRYDSAYLDESRVSGLALYSIPLGPSRCRLIYRAWSNFPRWADRVTPRAIQHWTQCEILEQDMQVVVGQAAETGAAGAPLRDLWHPLGTSDALVLRYRRWLDAYGASLPSYRGLATARGAAPTGAEQATDRATLHTRICASCTRAERTARRTARVLNASAFALLAAGAVAGGSAWTWAAVAAALACGLGSAAARRISARFR